MYIFYIIVHGMVRVHNVGILIYLFIYVLI